MPPFFYVRVRMFRRRRLESWGGSRVRDIGVSDMGVATGASVSFHSNAMRGSGSVPYHMNETGAQPHHSTQPTPGDNNR